MEKPSSPVVIFLEQPPAASSEFFKIVSAAAKNGGIDFRVAESVPEAERQLKKLHSLQSGPVALIIPVLYPDLLRAVKTLPKADPLMKLVFLYTKDEEQVARQMLASYVLVGLERTLAACEEGALTPVLEEAARTVAQRRRQRTVLAS